MNIGLFHTRQKEIFPPHLVTGAWVFLESNKRVVVEGKRQARAKVHVKPWLCRKVKGGGGV